MNMILKARKMMEMRDMVLKRTKRRLMRCQVEMIAPYMHIQERVCIETEQYRPPVDYSATKKLVV